mgnify:CR=1 FL=1
MSEMERILSLMEDMQAENRELKSKVEQLQIELANTEIKRQLLCEDYVKPKMVLQTVWPWESFDE